MEKILSVNNRKIITLAEFSFEEIISHFEKESNLVAWSKDCDCRRCRRIYQHNEFFDFKMEYKGYRFNFDSFRIKTFLKSNACYNCGRVGNLWKLQKCKDSDAPHINLFCRDNSGDYLMTKDHFHPKSKGGRECLENLNTMCYHCNNKKGDKIIPGYSK